VNVEQVLDKIEDVLESAWHVPMSGRSVVDISEIEELIKNLRLVIPKEIARANEIMSDKDKILESAHKKCEKIYKAAKQKVQLMVSEHEIVKTAKIKEAEILKEFNFKYDELTKQTKQYLRKILEELEEFVTFKLKEIRNAKQMVNDIKII